MYGVSEETYLRCCNAVMNALISKIGRIIKFPQRNEFQDIADAFNSSGKQFPNVVGCLDGTHIKVEIKRNFDSHSYYNYKKFHSIHLLAVCRDDLSFTYIHTGWPGQN